MAEKNRYPQIPSTVWWGVRSILQRTPTATIDERLLGVQLGVQEAAARQYITELRSVGILTEDGKATAVAQKWRLDDTYSAAVKEIVTSTYPEGLLHIAPPGQAERQKVVSWFLREGLGQGAAGNKAATYLLISNLDPTDAPTRAGTKPAKTSGATASTSPRRTAGQGSSAADRDAGKRNAGGGDGKGGSSSRHSESIPLNVNVQIHISADAGPEQIESIFAAMRRYLYDRPNS